MGTQLIGGPWDGYVYDSVLCPSQKTFQGFVYQLGPGPTGRTAYLYDAAASHRALIANDHDPQLAAQALNPQEGLRPDDTHDGMTVPVEVRRYPDRWELWATVGDTPTLVESLPRAAFADGDTDGLKQWVEASVDALAQEAMKG